MSGSPPTVTTKSRARGLPTIRKKSEALRRLRFGAPRLLLRGEETYFGAVPDCVFALCFLR